jgi:polar amino acid transport system substrate-binding protein
MMKIAAMVLAVALSLQAAYADSVAPTGTLRAIYLAGNPAQAVRDASGEVRGVAIDLARDLAKRRNVPLALIPGANPAAVIDAVAKGEADIGFVAFAPERAGAVLFSQVYMLVQQTFIVPDGSNIRSVTDIDAGGLRVAGGQGDSVTLYMKRNFKSAKLVETDNTPADMKRKFSSGDIDAFGANRQRLTTLLKDMAGYRLLPDNLFGVPQTIIVGKDKTEALAAIDTFIDAERASGALARSLTTSGIVGTDVAPPGHRLDR